MAFHPEVDGGGGGAEANGSTPWHILSTETITVATRREFALHGELLLEGELVLEGTARLVLNE